MGQPDLEVGRSALESDQWEDNPEYRPDIQQDKAVVQQGYLGRSAVESGQRKEENKPK